MLDVNTINALLEFLGRTQLSGNEVPTFVHCTNALHAQRNALMAPPPPAPLTAPAPRRQTKARKTE